MDHAFKAALFDLDGTLIDTEMLCNAAGVVALTKLGHPLEPAFFETLAGVHDDERLRRINAHLGTDLEAGAFFDAWDHETRVLMDENLPVKPGAPELLAALKARGLKLALCTSSRRGPAHEKLQKAGLLSYFDAVISVDDVAHAKPDPDPYRRAAAALGFAPEACIAFEDSEVGAESAKRAGAFTVQVPDLHAASGRWADLVAPSLLEGAREAGLI